MASFKVVQVKSGLMLDSWAAAGEGSISGGWGRGWFCSRRVRPASMSRGASPMNQLLSEIESVVQFAALRSMPGLGLRRSVSRRYFSTTPSRWKDSVIAVDDGGWGFLPEDDLPVEC